MSDGTKYIPGVANAHMITFICQAARGDEPEALTYLKTLN